jgi:hypothetical protein
VWAALRQNYGQTAGRANRVLNLFIVVAIPLSSINNAKQKLSADKFEVSHKKNVKILWFFYFYPAKFAKVTG